MATVRPFHGLRYTSAAGAIQSLIAPPYDVVSDSERDAYADKSPHNVVRLTLPEKEKDDRNKYVKYARSAARLEEWRRDGKLARDESAAYYRYTQKFALPGGVTICERTKLITTIKVEPYRSGVVLPHEQTFPKHKEDRMRILEATRTHLECIFGLIEDADKSVHSLVASANANPLARFETPEDGITHALEMIADASVCEEITRTLSPKKVWIADGHHRYETALAFRERLGERPDLIAEDFMMMALCSISDPGLVLLPTHRILKQMPIDARELRNRLSSHFKVTDCANDRLMQTISQSSSCALGVALPGGLGFVAEAPDRAALAALVESDVGSDLKRLDVSILHNVVFSKILGLTGHDFFGYTRIEKEAVAAVEVGAPAAILMNPPSVDDMRRVASAGDFMPQKSTYYYPKLLSGLVMWSLKDFAP